MIDLVERLRTSWDVDRSIISQTSGWDRERKEAADEITALRARLEAVEKERDNETINRASWELEARTAQAALATARRDALEEAAKICDCRDREKDDSMYLVGCIDASQANAKRIRALAKGGMT